MDRKERWRRAAAHPRSCTFEELRALLEAYGWVARGARGSHRYYVRDGRLLSIPFRRGTVLMAYARLVLENTGEDRDD